MPTVNAVLNPTGLAARSRPPIDLFFEISIEDDVLIITPGTVATETVQDQVVSEQTPATYGQKFVVSVELTPESGELDTITITSNDTNIATVENGNELTYVADGICTFDIEVTNTLGSSFTRTISLTFDEMTGTVVTEVVGAAPGSVRENVVERVDPIIEAMYFDGSDDYVSIPAMPTATNATIEFKVYGINDIHGVFLSDRNTNSIYLGVYDQSAGSSPQYSGVGSSTPTVKINNSLLTTRQAVYSAIIQDGVHTILIEGANISSWEEVDVGWYQNNSAFRVTGVIYDLKIDLTGNGTWDHHYLGNDNTNAGWTDQIGSNDGTVNGSPQLARNALNQLNLYTTQNHSAPSYTRNPNCWANSVLNNLTCISPWNSTNSNRRAGTLITPRHIIFAAHYQISNGATIRFIDPENNVVTRTMTHKRVHPDYSPYFPDLVVGILDSDVPADILPCKVLPDNWQTYLPTSIDRIPCLTLDQEEKALITDGYNLSSSYTSFRAPLADSARSDFYESKIVGDSGNPAFLIISGELVLLTVWTYGGAGSGTSITYFKNDINQMIESVDALASVNTGYTLTEIDLSTFNTY